MHRIPGALAALLLALPVAADAQFTTFTAPSQRREKAVAESAQVREAVRTDSLSKVTLSDMKAWVDSAAGALAVRVDTGVAVAQDSARRTQVQSAGDVERTPPAPGDSARSFRDGAPAPDTATPLPGIALAGLALLGTGLWLRRRA